MLCAIATPYTFLAHFFARVCYNVEDPFTIIMRVLMFGWEFPPHNSGGLGTACFGLTRALANRNIEVLFVLPKKVGVSASFMNILFADERRVKFHEIETTLKPYVTSEGYIRERDKIFSDVYGNTLMQEV